MKTITWYILANEINRDRHFMIAYREFVSMKSSQFNKININI